ncbi:glycosyltransferase family 4 protein [Scytonema hofmannii FACHB-248]|uniref:Glycosyltransferase family 4 protein n=1 Tax=Scytonema hofmannii FACHB-248 TaxID=1842502 RepID=A0ABR8GPD2_9CYAN|nr:MULTISPECIES: glycosyltransferase family 4 protein [Nostocales]MBD2605018.1 glycosyltransferase family 4 protein [Scytonema hofmannii FACHB-248]
MEQISQIDARIQDKTAYPDILVISRTFLPNEGGIAEYIYNRCLQDPERVIVLAGSCSGDKAFDRDQQFPVYRWSNPRFLRSGFVQNTIKHILNLVWSFVLAMQLYFRYRYRYIEWGHGYNFLCLLLLSYLLPIRFFIYLHGNDVVHVLHNPLWRSLFALTLIRAEGIVCKSSFIKDYLKANFRFNTPTHIINPILRPEKFADSASVDSLDNLRVHIREAYNIPEKSVVILSVGQLEKCKGFDKIIENLTLLLTQGIDVHYILCGQGACELELKSLARRLRVDKRVHFAGYVSDRELAGYYAACDLFAMLTLFDTKSASIEGFDPVYLEAGYFGKPVIASCLGGVIDAVRHEENGILVNPNSGCEIFQAFSRLCKDQQLREKLGRIGKELAKRKTLHRTLYASRVS